MTLGTCNVCDKPIRWETLGRARVYVVRAGRYVYSTQCDCGQVERDGAGRRLVAPRS